MMELVHVTISCFGYSFLQSEKDKFKFHSFSYDSTFVEKQSALV